MTTASSLRLGVAAGLWVAALAGPRLHAADQPGYLLPDGSVQVVASRALAGVVGKLNALYQLSHPGTRFTLVEGNDGTAMASLTFGATPFAPMGGEFTAAGLTAMRKLVGPDPLAIRIAHASCAPAAEISPPAIVVNRDNPLAVLSWEQAERIFCAGAPKSDLTSWGQLGLAGAWIQRPIHPCGLPESDYDPSDDPGLGAYLVGEKLPGLHFSHRYEAKAHYSEVLARVRDDPAAIGIVALNRVTPEVKVVALSGDAWSTPSRGTPDEIARGRYPLDRFVYLYLRRVPGRPLDAFAVDYVRLVLSAEGQEALAAESARYIPLNSAERDLEKAKLP